MMNSRSTRTQRSTKIQTTLRIGLIVLLNVALGSSLIAQETIQESPNQLSPLTPLQPELSADEQKKLVNEVYESTKTAKTAEDFTAMLDLCKRTLEKSLSESNEKYVSSLSAWAMNRRGELRLEFAQQLKKVANAQWESILQTAMDDFDLSVKTDPTRYRTWMSRGAANIEKEDFRRAALDFTNAIKLKTDQPSAWFNRAESLVALDRFKEAIEDYTVVLRLNSEDAEALNGRGLAYSQTNEFESALKDFDQLVALLPEDPNVLINRGDVHEGMKSWSAAQADYQKSMTMERSPIVLQRMAWLLATCPSPEMVDAEKSLELIREAIKSAGETPDNLDTLAAVEAAAGNFVEAKSQQSKAIELVSGQEEATKVYQARLALYEDDKPFRQSEVTAEPKKEDEPKKDDATESNPSGTTKK
jgi:tetratricopeptide (TPR) repeat protein